MKRRADSCSCLLSIGEPPAMHGTYDQQAPTASQSLGWPYLSSIWLVWLGSWRGQHRQRRVWEFSGPFLCLCWLQGMRAFWSRRATEHPSQHTREWPECWVRITPRATTWSSMVPRHIWLGGGHSSSYWTIHQFYPYIFGRGSLNRLQPGKKSPPAFPWTPKYLIT